MKVPYIRDVGGCCTGFNSQPAYRAQPSDGVVPRREGGRVLVFEMGLSSTDEDFAHVSAFQRMVTS